MAEYQSFNWLDVVAFSLIGGENFLHFGVIAFRHHGVEVFTCFHGAPGGYGSLYKSRSLISGFEWHAYAVGHL